MGNPDDIHDFPKRYQNALVQLEKSNISQKNKDIILKYARDGRKKGNRLSTITNNINTMRWLAVAVDKDLDKITEDEFYNFIELLEVEGKNTMNYKKEIKKFFRWLTEDNPPKWIQKLRIPQHNTPVQPSDLLTKAEIDKLLNACKHPRDKALIAVLLDSCMRIGAVGTLRIQNIEFNQSGAVLYMSTTSKNQKTTVPKPFPITWSTGYLNAWLDLHPDRNNPKAPLWVVIRGSEIKAMTYPGLVMILKRVSKKVGLDKKVHFHLFKHQKVTDMILHGYSEQQIRFQAGWSHNSNHMFQIYGNYFDKDMVESIYTRAGLSSQKKQVTLLKCPRCHAILVPEARVCHQCALVLDAGLEKEREAAERDIMQKVLMKIVDDPEARGLLKDLVKERKE